MYISLSISLSLSLYIYIYIYIYAHVRTRPENARHCTKILDLRGFDSSIILLLGGEFS